MWWAMKEWIHSGGVIPDNIALKQELATPTYKYTQQGKRQLESKDQIKERLMGASPDRADALALTFAHPVARRRERTLFDDLQDGRQKKGFDYDPYSRIS